MILSWHEHLTDKEIPPRWMWHLDDDLERHFERVKAARAGNGDLDDDEDEPGGMMQNEYARNRGANLR